MSHMSISNDWDEFYVIAWLDTLSLKKYEDYFYNNHINGFCLLRLENSLLKDMNIVKVSDRIKILEEIRSLLSGNVPNFSPEKIKEIKRTYIRNRQNSSKENLTSDRQRVVLKIIGEENQTVQVGVSDQMSYKDIMSKILNRFGLIPESNLHLYNLLFVGDGSTHVITDVDLLSIIQNNKSEKDKLVLRKKHIVTPQKTRKVHKLENFFGEDFDGKVPSPSTPKQSVKLNKFFGDRPPSNLITTNLQNYFPRETMAEIKRVSRIPDMSAINMDGSSPSSLLSTTVNTPDSGASPRRAKSDRKPDLKINTSKDDHSESLPDSPTNIVSAGPIKFIKGNLIGKGSFGSVYLGMNAINGELLAIKLVEMPSEDGPNYEQKTRMYRALQHEIALLKQLNHPHIVRYLGSQMQDNNLNIFLEYVAGGSVQGLLVVLYLLRKIMVHLKKC
eukprot:NODE_178_length_15814_cov_0.338657.p6 type:complete len:444 gc:universal NODE_178_length_15814_cov_0.338657:3982-2651(-)